jgi:hypothetical protein
LVSGYSASMYASFEVMFSVGVIDKHWSLVGEMLVSGSCEPYYQKEEGVYNKNNV